MSSPQSIRVGGTSFGSRDEKAVGVSPQILGTMVGTGGKGFEEPGDIYKGLIYQVHILGEVKEPGTYRIPASTRLLEALQLADGILEMGSEREIELRRNQGISKIDLFSFKLFGDLNNNPYLLDNDVISVPLKKKVVEIQGTIKRPGVYEIKDEKNLEDLIQLAGGFTPGANGSYPIKVIRFKKGIKELIDVQDDKESMKKFPLENGDVFVIPHFITADKKFDYNLARLPGDNRFFYPTYEERVFVLGAVASPGPYPYFPYYEVRQYLTLAGGPTKLAKPERRWRVVRTDGKKTRAHVTTKINPGDAIVIPEKYMPPESMLSLVLGLTTSVLGIATMVLTLAR